MAGIARQVYVVSDIHIGGVYPQDDDKDDRGFRIATHIPRFTAFIQALATKPLAETEVELVINGDFIDFLAEADGAGNEWVPFTSDPDRAVQKLQDIVERDRPVFDALSQFLHRGHRLTLLLGNHDIELALPRVRQRFVELLEVDESHKYSFIFDGEAYVVGEVLIEHGNRYDKFNVVDHDGLRRVRSLQSRNQEVPEQYAFKSPPGSSIVASIMNPIKVEYPFIDLLKPETGAAIPVLLALEPGARSKITEIASIALGAHKHRMAAPAMPGFGGDIGSDEIIDDFGGDISSFGDDSMAASGGPAGGPDDPLRSLLQDCLGADADDFLDELDKMESEAVVAPMGEDISSAAPTTPGWMGDTFERGWGLMRLALSRNDADVERRLPMLLSAVRALSKNESFNRSVESASEYLDAANELARGGFKCVIFGHTHLPKDVALDGGARYINTGTWADFMKFPEAIISGPKEEAIAGLREFMSDMQAGRLSAWVGFSPTYARIEVAASGALLEANLCDYDGSTDV